MFRAFATIGMGLLLLICVGMGDPWPHWRGPAFNGSSEETDLPTTWTATENVAWTIELPGRSGGTPIVWNDRVFVTACEEPSLKLTILCLDAAKGNILWQRDAGEGIKLERGNTSASPSPVTDGNLVFFYFGTGRLMAFDMAGALLWDRNIAEKYGRFEIKFGYSTSPLLYDGKLYIQVIHGWSQQRMIIRSPAPPSYLLRVDPTSGEDLWKHIRGTDAIGESYDAYTSPYIVETDKGPRIIMNGANYVTAHDPETGRELWRSDSWNAKADRMYRTIASSSAVDGVVVAAEPRGRSIFAYNGNTEGQLKPEDRLWTSRENAPDVCVPLGYNKRLFVLDGLRRAMTCRNPHTGAILGKRDMESDADYYASPTGADGKIYCINLAGEAVVLAADDELKELHRVAMGDHTSGSSIAIANNRLYIRTNSKLFCIQQSP